MPPIRVLVGLITVSIAAVMASADSLRLAFQLQPDPWAVEPAMQRFAGAATHLPALGTVGYISDVPFQGRGMLAFLVAQYALAPRLLAPVEQTHPQQAVGNFSQRIDYLAAGAKAGYRMEVDLGNGVVLYREVQ